MEEEYEDVDVPPWAMKLIVTGEEDLSEGEQEMNIKRAKQEIKDSIEAYLKKNEYGEYEIPSITLR